MRGRFIQCRRKTEPVFDQGLFSGSVPTIHADQLRKGDVTLVDHQEVVPGEVVQEGGRRFSGSSPCQVAGVVFRFPTLAKLLKHLQVEIVLCSNLWASRS